MGRKKKYVEGVEIITVSIDKGVLAKIDEKVKSSLVKSRSGFITQILTNFAKDDMEYCRMKARESAQDLYYWRGRIEMFEKDGDLM